MGVDDINKEIEGIRLPKKKPGKTADLSVKHAGVKVLLTRLLAILLLGIILSFSILVIAHFKDDANMTRVGLIIIVYLALGGLLAYKLWDLTYFGWLFSLLLALAGVFLSALTMYNKGFIAVVLSILVISLLSALVLWWVRDLFGIKRIGDIFNP